MSTMTLGELKAEVMSAVGADYTADIVRYLNKGLLELSELSQIITRTEIGTVNGIFALPSDCLIIKDILYKGIYLSRYDKTDFPDKLAGTPLYWQRDGDNIELYPVPEGMVAVTLVYAKREAVMEAEDDAHTLEHADEFLIAFAKWKVLIDTKGVSDEALYWRQESEAEKEKWRKLNLAQHHRPRKVRVGRWG